MSVVCQSWIIKNGYWYIDTRDCLIHDTNVVVLMSLEMIITLKFLRILATYFSLYTTHFALIYTQKACIDLIKLNCIYLFIPVLKSYGRRWKKWKAVHFELQVLFFMTKKYKILFTQSLRRVFLFSLVYLFIQWKIKCSSSAFLKCLCISNMLWLYFYV